MDELHSPWSPPRRARTARGIRPTTPTHCHTFDSFDDALFRGSLSGSGLVSPYAASSWRQRPPSGTSAGGREAGRSPSARSRRPESRSPFSAAPPMLSLARSLRLPRTPPALGSPTASAPHPHPHSAHHLSHRSTASNGGLGGVFGAAGGGGGGGGFTWGGLGPSSGGSGGVLGGSHVSSPLLSFGSSPGPRRTGPSISVPVAPIISPPASPAHSPSSGSRGPDLRSSVAGRPGSPRGGSNSLLASTAPSPGTAVCEPDPYVIQMAALTEQLQRREEERNRRNVSPGKAAGASGSPQAGQRRVSTTWDMARMSHSGAAAAAAAAAGFSGGGLTRDREAILHGQISVAAMQQRLQHKFGEEAAAFMLHDLKEVPEHLHVLFYAVILQLRELPSPLPSSLGEAYHAVFTQHFDRTVSAAERRHSTFRTQMAQLQVQTQVQLEAMQQKVTELSPRGARPTAQAQLQQLQKHVQQQAHEHQAQLKMYQAQAIAAQELHSQVMRLLCVAVAAQERLSLEQLSAMGLGGVLEHLPAWEVLFQARDGVLMMADSSLESWLVDKKAAKQFACDPRVGHAVLGHHYREVAERDVRALDAYGLRYAVLHLLLSDEEVTGGERLLMDPEYMEQVFRLQEEGTLYLTLLRLTHKTEPVSESLRWMRHNMGALRTYPRAVATLWQAAPSRTLFARLVAAAEGRGLPGMKQVSSFGEGPGRLRGAGAGADWDCDGDGNSDNGGDDNGHDNGNGKGNGNGHAHHGTRGSSTDMLTSPRGSGGGGGGHRGRFGRPQCRLLNPPPFWPAAITQLPGHVGGVTGLVFDRRNRLLSAATAAGTVLVWDHATARRVGTLTAYSPLVPCVDMHPSGRLLAVGSSTDSAVRVRALDSGSGPLLVFSEPQPDPVVKTLHGPKNSAVRHLSYSPDGHLLAVVYGDGTVTVWDPVKGVRSSTMPVLNKATAARYASFSPNGQLLALACANGTIRVWHLERLNPLHISVLRAYDSHVAIRCVHYSPSGLLLVSLAEGASDVLLWDVSTGNQLQALSGQPGAAPVRALAFSPGGLLLATAGEDGDVCIWNANTRGQWLLAACLRGHSFAVNALAFSPCGLILATGGNEDGVRMWDMGSILHRSEAQRADLGYGLSNPAGSGGGGAVAALQTCITIRGDELASSGRHPTPGVISCLTHSPSGSQLAAGLSDGAVCVWDSMSPRHSIRLVGEHHRPVGRVTYSADGNLLASASDDGVICVWNTSSIDVSGLTLVATIFVDDALYGGASSKDGRECSTPGGGGGGGSTQPPPAPPPPPQQHSTAWAAPAPAPQAAAAVGVAAAPAGRRTGGGGAGGWVTLSCTIAFSHNASHIASAHDDGSVVLWALPSGLMAVRLEGHVMLASGLQYSPDGRLLASSSDDGVMCIWDPAAAVRAAREEGDGGQKPEPLARLVHRDHVYDMDFNPAGTSLASISRDGDLAVWDARSGARTARSPHGHGTASKCSVEGLRYSPTGLLLATWSGKDATVRLWHAASCVLLRELTGLRLMDWGGLGPGPWAAVLRVDYAPFVVRLPERALLLEAAVVEAGGCATDNREIVEAAADEVAEGLAGAAVGLPPLPQTGPAAQRRLEQLQRCRALTFSPRGAAATDDDDDDDDDADPRDATPLVPLLGDRATPLRPCVRIFSGTRSVPHVSLRGRSLVLADSGSTAFYSVTHESSAHGTQDGARGSKAPGSRAPGLHG